MEIRMARAPHGIVTICSGKGGVGKTTSTLAIAGGLKVLGALPDAVMDLDYGGSLTRAYGYAPATAFSERLLDGDISFEAALHPTEEAIMLIPSTASLANVEKGKMHQWRDRLRELAKTKLLVVDTSDDILSAPVAAAILAADILAIPVPLSKKAYDRTYSEIAGLLKTFSHHPEEVWFATMVDQRASLPRHVLQTIADDGVELAALIPKGISIDEADYKLVSVVASEPKSKPALAYIELSRTIYARLRRLTGAQPGGTANEALRDLPPVATTVNG
jgi:cellulose biosynthesis protein BcsQ